MTKQAMTDEEVIAELQRDTLVNRVRKAMISHAGKMEQAQQQRRPIGVTEMRRAEIEAAREIVRMVREWDDPVSVQERLLDAQGIPT